MSGRRSRDKGKRGERELAKLLNEQFPHLDACRGVQYQGGDDSPDVRVSDDCLHFEIKRVERLNLYQALEQATEDGNGKLPVVLHKKNRKPAVAIVPLERLQELVVRLYLGAMQ